MQGEHRGRQRGGLIQRARAGAGLGAVGTVAGGAAADADGVDVAGRSEHGEFLLVPADGASGRARTRAAISAGEERPRCAVAAIERPPVAGGFAVDEVEALLQSPLDASPVTSRETSWSASVRWAA